MSKLSRWWDRHNEKYREHTRFWRTLNKTSLVMMYSFVFLTFCTIGLINTISDFRYLPSWATVLLVLSPGLFAMGYVFVSTRLHWIFVLLLMPVQFAFYWLFNRAFLHQLPNYKASVPGVLLQRLFWINLLAGMALAASYSIVIGLFNREGRRYFRFQAEMQLASEIHSALVPPIRLQVAGYEIYGLSLPSGEVGGDLVDVVSRDNDWIAYLADVSGHGVSSGVLMAMLKSATRMSLRNYSNTGTMLDEVNEVFYSLKAPNSFATFAAISHTQDRGLEILVAGHLPVLHCNGEKITELDTPGLPVGVMPTASFCAVSVRLLPGDVLAIFTDGLTEVFNKQQVELGSDYIKETLLQECGRPLPQIASTLIATAGAWGRRSDDQSLLLVRRSA